MADGGEGRIDLVAEARRLGVALEDLIETLQAHQDMLRQIGMGLPPGTFSGFATIREEIRLLIARLNADMADLARYRTLADTATQLAASLDVQQVLDEAMDSVIALTGAERGYILLRDEDTGEMVFSVARNLDRETLDESGFMVSRTIVDEVIATGQPIVTTNAQDDPRYATQESVMFFALRSILCVPLVARGEMIGVVYADNRVKDALFGQDELALLVAFADQAAVAIENARLFTRLQRALAEASEMSELMDNVLASVASGVMTTDINAIITLCNEAAESILGTPRAEVLHRPLRIALPTLYGYIRPALDAIFAEGKSEVIEADLSLPNRQNASLVMKLTPLRSQPRSEEAIQGVAIVLDDLTEIKQRDATLAMVRRYLPPAMVDQIQSLDELGLGGERRVITVVFVETLPLEALPAGLPPAEQLARINQYLTAAADAIQARRGLVDKFIGSEVMGLFNTQLNPDEDHAWQALLAAMDMHRRLQEFADADGEHWRACRISVHTGVATLGNVGNPTRRDFTAIGDMINVAKRLQEQASYGQVIISEDTYRLCQDRISEHECGLEITEHTTIQVRGRRQPVTVYEVICTR